MKIRKKIAKRKSPDQGRLLASESRYRRLFETARDGILILDAATRKIREVNPFMMGLLGYSHQEVVGGELWEIGLIRNAEASDAIFRELHEKGYVHYDDWIVRTKQGENRLVEFTSNVYTE